MFLLWDSTLYSIPKSQLAVWSLPSSGKPGPGPNLVFISQVMSSKMRGKCPSQCPQLNDSSTGAQL